MKKFYYKLIIFIGIFVFLGAASDLQDDLPKKVFEKFEAGLSIGDVSKFSSFFGDKTYISLANGTAGYYSSNQAYYVLQDFLLFYKPTTFRITHLVSNSNNPFASGEMKYFANGMRGTAQVYVSLKNDNGTWQISQITIN